MKSGSKKLSPSRISPGSDHSMQAARVSLPPRASGLVLESADSVSRFSGLPGRALSRHEHTVHSGRATAETGSIMMITVIATCLLGLTLGSYLLMVRAESVSVARSQAWNAALTVAGAGVEEALAALNQNAAGQTNGWGPPDLSTNEWPRSGKGYGPLSRDLASASFTNGSYSIFVTTNSPPIIYSTGYVTIPAISAKISRVVCVRTTNAPLFTTAVAAQTGISIDYSGDFANSFDSSLGPYQDSKANANGNLACMSGNLTVAYRRIYGDVSLGATATLGGDTYLISGKTRNDMNVDFPEISSPNGAPPPPPHTCAYTNNNIRYDFDFSQSGDYSDSACNLNGKSVYVPTNKVVNLLITRNCTLNALCIAGTANAAGKLTVYMAAQNFTFGGTNIVENHNATNFNYVGLAGNTNVTLNLSLNGTPNFYGTIYAPSANVTVNADYTNVPCAIVGALTGRSVTIRGFSQVHYDENLARAGRRRGYVVTSWQEL